LAVSGWTLIKDQPGPVGNRSELFFFMNILIIDDSPDFRALLRLYLNKELDAPNIEDYDIERLGKPADNFDWSAYDILFLDYQLGEEEDGLDWLKDFRRQKDFPPAVVLTAEGD